MSFSRKQLAGMGIDLPALGTAAHKDRRKKSTTPANHDDARHKLFLAACKVHGLPAPIPEYKFCESRKWRFDWLFLDWLALEIEGGVFVGGRHVRGKGYLADLEKYNEGQILGYVILRVTPAQVQNGVAFALVKRALEMQ